MKSRLKLTLATVLAIFISIQSANAQIIDEDFINQTKYSATGNSIGGALFLNKREQIELINGKFINNSAISEQKRTLGGAIYNANGTITSIIGTFDGNKSISRSTNHQDYAYGGAISNSYEISGINADFTNNYAEGELALGGAIFNNMETAKIEKIEGNFVNNHVKGRSNNAWGGAVYQFKGMINEISGSFLGNYAQTDALEHYAFGGAIWTNDSITISTNNEDIIFSGNYTQDSRGKINNAIFIATSKYYPIYDETKKIIGYNYVFGNPKLTLKAEKDRIIQFDDTIDGGHLELKDQVWEPETLPVYDQWKDKNGVVNDTRYTLALTGDESGQIFFNNDVINANIVQDTVTTTVSYVKYLNHELNEGKNNLTMNSGVLNIHNMGLTNLGFKEMALNGGEINLFGVKADLKNGVIGRISADSSVVGDTVVNIRDLSVNSDAKEHLSSLKIAESGMNVNYSGNSTLLAPIFKYSTEYDAISGNLNFIRGAGIAESDWHAFNPSILASSAALQGIYSNQLEVNSIAMSNSESFMMLPASQRLVMKSRNRFAANPDVGVFSPLYSYENEDAFWVKTYASFENIPLHNGPKVGNINYGTVIGHDSEVVRIGHGFERVITPYIAYTGNSQRFQGISTTQNGGLLGGTITLYKNNFFNATTISAGATAGESSTMYGSENFTMLSAGIGNKAGYNFEFKGGKFIVQPALLVSYTFVNTFDYNNAAGVRIKSDPLNAIQVAPGIKFIGNTKSGWQPYIAVNFVYNILDKTRVRADEVKLPEMSIKPYVEYGVGVQKIFKNDRFIAFAQAMMRSGGRSGVSLNAGLRWRLGRIR